MLDSEILEKLQGSSIENRIRIIRDRVTKLCPSRLIYFPG